MNLSEQSMQSLMERYYSGEPVAALIKDFNLDIAPPQLISIFPPIIHADLCPYCGVHYHVPRGSRVNSSLDVSSKWTRCPKCGHTISGYCTCRHCKELVEQQRKEDEKKIREAINAFIIRNIVLPDDSDIGGLSLQSLFYLLSFLRGGLEEDLIQICSLNEWPQSLSPHQAYTHQIISHLTQKNLIFPALSSTTDAFEFEESRVVRYYPKYVRWNCLYPDDDVAPGRLLTLVENHIDRFLTEQDTADALFDIWRELALYEVLAYLEQLMAKHGFDLRIGEKTRLVINQVLEHYSIAQVFNFCWAAVRNAASFYLSNNISKRHAANTIVGHIQQRAERALTENWEIKAYRRNYNIPPSISAMVFSNKITALGEDYLFVNPCPSIL